ncbi:MAG: MlaD family protein [Candidatus Gastranaerophilales bacterium]|nr:MlaD family protein [Candidatus Gastranaerophilales bacterium]
MKLSSSFKVGILSLTALLIFFCTVLWVKGRAFSSADRIEVYFKDVNGMRPGSAVQMMGLRVGQVEEIIPVVDGETSYVKMKFVITDPNVKIPKASMISIQQSGLIGEQFLEITPPKLKSVYIPVNSSSLEKGAKVQIKLDEKYYDVGYVKKTQILSRSVIPVQLQEVIGTHYAFRYDYVVDLPGLILPEFMVGSIINDNGELKLRIKPLDNAPIPYPIQNSPYTILEPMRIADFLDLQYQAAESLTVMNRKVNDLLDDNLIADLKQSALNVKMLTAQATSTLGKAELLIDESRKDLNSMMGMMNDVSGSFNDLSKNINRIIADPQFKPTLMQTAKSLTNLTNELTPIIGAVDAQKFANDLSVTINNVAEISNSINRISKDQKLKDSLMMTVDNVNRALCNVSATLEVINNTKDKANVKQVVEDTAATVHNLRTFSEKLNKRFLLFRLLF